MPDERRTIPTGIIVANVRNLNIGNIIIVRVIKQKKIGGSCSRQGDLRSYRMFLET
jgi:hypothetical protein